MRLMVPHETTNASHKEEVGGGDAKWRSGGREVASQTEIAGLVPASS